MQWDQRESCDKTSSPCSFHRWMEPFGLSPSGGPHSEGVHMSSLWRRSYGSEKALPWKHLKPWTVFLQLVTTWLLAAAPIARFLGPNDDCLNPSSSGYSHMAALKTQIKSHSGHFLLVILITTLKKQVIVRITKLQPHHVSKHGVKSGLSHNTFDCVSVKRQIWISVPCICLKY